MYVLHVRLRTLHAWLRRGEVTAVLREAMLKW